MGEGRFPKGNMIVLFHFALNGWHPWQVPPRAKSHLEASSALRSVTPIDRAIKSFLILQ